MEPKVPMFPRTAALAMGLTWLPLSPALALEVGVAPATRKILPDTPFPTETAAYLRAARNEWEGVQLVIRADGPLTSVDVTAGDLQHCQLDATLPGDDIRIYREVFLDIEEPSPISVTYHERVAGRFPDPLVPLRDPHDPGSPAGAPFEVADGDVAVVFVDVYVPADAEPALYQGTLTVSADGEDSVAVPLSVTVWPFELPAARSMATSYGFSDNQIRKFHGGPDGDPPDDHQQIVDRYIEELHVHRVDRTIVGGSVEFEFDDDGALLEVDWGEYDAAVGPYLDGSRFADGVGVNRFNVGRFRPGPRPPRPSQSTWTTTAGGTTPTSTRPTSPGSTAARRPTSRSTRTPSGCSPPPSCGEATSWSPRLTTRPWTGTWASGAR